MHDNPYWNHVTRNAISRCDQSCQYHAAFVLTELGNPFCSGKACNGMLHQEVVFYSHAPSRGLMMPRVHDLRIAAGERRSVKHLRHQVALQRLDHLDSGSFLSRRLPPPNADADTGRL